MLFVLHTEELELDHVPHPKRIVQRSRGTVKKIGEHHAQIPPCKSGTTSPGLDRCTCGLGRSVHPSPACHRLTNHGCSPLHFADHAWLSSRGPPENTGSQGGSQSVPSGPSYPAESTGPSPNEGGDSASCANQSTSPCARLGCACWRTHEETDAATGGSQIQERSSMSGEGSGPPTPGSSSGTDGWMLLLGSTVAAFSHTAS